MSSANESADRAATEPWQRVDDFVQRFEKAWRSGSRPALSDFLPPDGPDRPAVLVELVHVDLERRLKAGEAARVEEYLDRYPELGGNSDEVLDLIAAEYEQRRRGESGLHIEEYTRRFPALVGELRVRIGPATIEGTASAGGGRDTADPGPGRPTGGPRARPAPAPPPASPAWPQLAGYQVLGELGRGAMGVVYKVRHLGLGRVEALKMILSEADAPRFRREAEAVARLNHPHFVQIYTVGDLAGRPFFTMELVEGGTLTDRLGSTPWQEQEAAQLLESLSRAVHAAHQCGVIHRDLKPGNILLDPHGVPKITDFGLAKDLAGSINQTPSGALLGTPEYMAPEQAEARTGAIGPATDVYALGSILYELLTGRTPFQADTPFDTLLQVVSQRPVPPSRMRLGLSRGLESICLKCLEKKPAWRYGSALALANDLGRFLAGKRVVARYWGAVSGAVPRRLARSPIVWSLTGAAVIACAVLLVISLGHRTEPAPNPLATQSEQQGQVGPAPPSSVFRHGAPIRAVAFAQDAGTLLTAGDDGLIRVWETGTANERGRFEGGVDPPAAVGFSGDGELLAVATNSEGLSLHDLTTGKVRKSLSARHGKIVSLGFAADGKTLGAVGADGTVILWEARTGKELPQLPGQPILAKGAAVSSDGRMLACFGETQICVWDVASGDLPAKLQEQESKINCVAFSPDDTILAAADVQGNIQLWEMRTGRLRAHLQGSAGPLLAIAFSPTGGLLAAGGEDANVLVWSLAKGKEVMQCKGQTAPISCVTFSSTGGALAAGSADGVARCWKTEGWSKLVAPTADDLTVGQPGLDGSP
jgi:WD40 repeat protein/tRNA A-37 threonylcarbamoyl transferase component Bud32